MEEPLNLKFPPVFEDVAEGVADLDRIREEEIQKLEEQAKALMEQDQADPRTQSYFMRLDKKTVVKDDKEYVSCQVRGIPMKVVPYRHALQLLKDEDARQRRITKSKQKRKTAKASRRRNRK